MSLNDRGANEKISLFILLDKRWFSLWQASYEKREYKHGFCGGETGRTTIHQRSCSEGQCRCAGLLSYIGVGFVRGNSRHSWPNWALRLRFLFPRFVSTFPSPHPQGRSSVEQVLQIPAAFIHGWSCWGSFYIRPILDFPLWNGACILKYFAWVCVPRFCVILCTILHIVQPLTRVYQ